MNNCQDKWILTQSSLQYKDDDENNAQSYTYSFSFSIFPQVLCNFLLSQVYLAGTKVERETNCGKIL